MELRNSILKIIIVLLFFVILIFLKFVAATGYCSWISLRHSATSKTSFEISEKTSLLILRHDRSASGEARNRVSAILMV